MNQRNLLRGIFAALVIGLVVVGCGRQDNDRLAVHIGSRNPIGGSPVYPVEEATRQAPWDLYQFHLIVWNGAGQVESGAFYGPLKLVIGGATRIFDAKAVPSRHQTMVPEAVTVVDNEVWIAPFSIRHQGSFVVEFKVVPEADLELKPTVLGVLAEIDGVRVIQLAKESS